MTKKSTKTAETTKSEGKNPVGAPAFFRAPEEMQVLIDKYFEECQMLGQPTTIPGLAYALGFVDRRSILDYKAKPEFTLTIKKARLRIEIERNAMLLTEQNAAGKIFDLKNNFDWVDRSEVGVSDETKNTRTPEEIKAMKKAGIAIVKALK